MTNLSGGSRANPAPQAMCMDTRFGDETPVVPRLLGDTKRVARRRTHGFACVELATDAVAARLRGESP